ncbi:hypothetical protein [Pseudoalteromonas luteoviolacea]|uniref:Uncharacterized protein n=1 Tax=Pseudoalteromonas luteoviolacea S4054 TaxID=1129367 RepID=A0A0F6ADU1_9GAMM|nr:hypothetical protein [Pseudoalteromonas luteoviolacea]AOT08375.1 hypothetical protein S4054249_11190 [Pseudoalteromonas luteoviolacea]AOT13291.1 hypothetical protein S40542_11165 [Pseudoalteromonas luteoviolacea]AOT18204.1 hypothetical protein S4054_11165 [Pseudoalteromonas luteoviolacea]KKE84323.1 hypothetical protein N479_10515 [Pseudoalteromonas luteoviolacea S4054]KZN76072.1 hypothetical protein N481_06900 [Pseudoalteromonas luteoviolacea S4047-1]
MDPLEKLTEKNKKYESIKRKERIEVIKHLPLTVLFIIIYLSIYVYLSVDSFKPNTDSLLGMSKQVWLFSMIISGGFCMIFFVGSLASLISACILCKHIKFKHISLQAALIPLLSIALSLAFFMLGHYLDQVINNHSSSIAKLLSFGYEATPFLITLPVNMLIAGTTIVLFKTLISVASIPLDAKKHVAKMIGTQ